MKAWKLVPFALLLAAASGCEMARHDRSSDTYLDPEASSFQIIDVAVAEPVVDALDAPTLVPAMRQAARTYVLDQKHYSIMSDAKVDAALEGKSLTASSDSSAAARAVDSDCTVLIHITSWDTSSLVARGRIYATGSIRVAAHADGRRLYEHSFQNELLLAPGDLSTTNRQDLQKQMAADLMQRSLAGFPKKSG